ncbi:DUF5698 domain-containing protein [Paenibacillus solisilvae]|uniref:UPF0316 protein ACFPYJ_12470 n=1 Tax=Paenibacillus solisilvae TaxID=2486751 RepID=A0ABW0W0I6_9BACL
MIGQLALIFILEAAFVTVMTCRWIILVKGSRYLAASASFFEQMLNVMALGLVVSNLDSPARVVAFGLGYAVGSIAGSWAEEKLAFGYTMFHVVTSPGSNLAEVLRTSGIGVTTWKADGGGSGRNMLYIVIRRRLTAQILKLIKETDREAFTVTSEPQMLKGGFLRKAIKTTSRVAIEDSGSAK